VAFGSQRVLAGFDLAVGRGETVVVLGPSGVGKSVALRLAVGLLRPDRGRVLLDGRDVLEGAERALLDVRRRLAMLFQGGALFDSMTVGENVAFGLLERRPRPPWPVVRDRVAEVLELVDLPGIEDRLPSSLSGGMRKRVALARALAVGPEAILYDEPTTGLDPVTTTRVDRLVRDLQRRLGVTSVVVTHDVDSAFAVADRIAFLQEGRVAFDGSVEEARLRPPPELDAFIRGEALVPEAGA
jgi:phospholipid/cholesterol/gamma-HCH transport system ATP-binding protein